VPARDIDQALVGAQRPGDPAPATVLVTKTILHAHCRHTLGEAGAAGPRMLGVVGMTQLVDMHRPDLVLAPAQHARPGGIEGDEIAFERRDAQKVLGHAPDAVALSRTL